MATRTFTEIDQTTLNDAEQTVTINVGRDGSSGKWHWKCLVVDHVAGKSVSTQLSDGGHATNLDAQLSAAASLENWFKSRGVDSTGTAAE